MTDILLVLKFSHTLLRMSKISIAANTVEFDTKKMWDTVLNNHNKDIDLVTKMGNCNYLKFYWLSQ